MSLPKLSTTLTAGLAILSLLLLLVAYSACTPTPHDRYATPEPVYDVELAREELASARKLWEANGSADYDLESMVWCECPESNAPLKLIVRNGAIESVINLNGGSERDSDLYLDMYTYKTISDRFDQIAAVVGDSPAYGLEVEYHPSLGYPTYLVINYDARLVDAGFTWKLLIYEPLDPSPPTTEPEASSRPAASGVELPKVVQWFITLGGGWNSKVLKPAVVYSRRLFLYLK